MDPSRTKQWRYHRILEKKPTKVFLGLGSNLGDREKNLSKALGLLGETGESQILQTSSLYETEPVDCPGGEWFLNQVAFLVTLMPVYSFLFQLLRIEKIVGRMAREKNSSREIDLDILFYGDHILHEADLMIPHPRLHLRRFVLEPLCEINAQWWHPVFKKTVGELLRLAPHTHLVRRATPAAR